MDSGTWVNIFIAVGSLVFTLVCCTAAIIVFLWKKFDAVYEQIEAIKIHQSTKFVKHDVCAIRSRDTRQSLNKDIENAILKHEVKDHGRTEIPNTA